MLLDARVADCPMHRAEESASYALADIAFVLDARCSHNSSNFIQLLIDLLISCIFIIVQEQLIEFLGLLNGCSRS